MKHAISDCVVVITGAFFAPGMGNVETERTNQLDIHVGGGGEGFIYKGLGVGAELGPLGPTKTGQPTSGWFDDAIGLGFS